MDNQGTTVAALLESFDCFSLTVWKGQKILQRSIV